VVDMVEEMHWRKVKDGYTTKAGTLFNFNRYTTILWG
jgi:hypothetical protein